MFGSTILDTAVGMVFVYLILSLLCMVINEYISSFLSLRAKTLEAGIKRMLDDPIGEKLVNQFYNYSLIKGISQNTRRPSYISPEVFVSFIMSLDVVQSFIEHPEIENKDMPVVLKHLIKEANGDLEEIRANIEQWFNNTMDRVSGWYKRIVQYCVFVLGLAIVIVCNIDTISYIGLISDDSTIRNTIVSSAQGYTNAQQKTNPQALQQNLGLIEEDIMKFQPVIGWSPSRLPHSCEAWFLKIIGLLATAIAISLGAPFWFDVLSKFMSLRFSGPPPGTT